MEPFVLPQSALTITELKVLDVALPSIAVAFTTARFIIKYGRKTPFGWDDVFAAVATIACTLESAGNFIHNVRPVNFSKATRLFAFYSVTESFYVSLWSARLSMLFSIIRIVPDFTTIRFLHFTAGIFGLFMLILTAQVFWVCEPQSGWKDMGRPQCVLGHQIGITQLVTDIVADTTLVLIPIRLLSHARLVRATKIRLVVLFGAAALVTVVSIVHTVYIILSNRPIEAAISGIIETSVATIVCNLVIILPTMWRLCGVQEQFPESIGLSDFSGTMEFARRDTQTDSMKTTRGQDGRDVRPVSNQECKRTLDIMDDAEVIINGQMKNLE